MAGMAVVGVVVWVRVWLLVWLWVRVVGLVHRIHFHFRFPLEQGVCVVCGVSLAPPLTPFQIAVPQSFCVAPLHKPPRAHSPPKPLGVAYEPFERVLVVVGVGVQVRVLGLLFALAVVMLSLSLFLS
jgi:hypothetical protein